MFKGSMVAIVTPMHASGEIDFDSLTNLIEMHIEAGTSAIIASGTTGESGGLSPKEHHHVIKHVYEQTKRRIPVIAGTGAISTKVTAELTLAAMEIGVEACLLVTPYYVRPVQEGLFLHYQAIAKAAAIPQIIYNVPSRTACDILPETIERLAGIPNIIGIKEATGKVERTQEILKRCGSRLDVYSGDDSTGFDLLKAGAKGVISVTANFAPKLMHEMCTLALAGNFDQAEIINQRLMPMHKAIGIETNPIPIKWALYQRGLIPTGIRLPLTPLAPQYHGQVLSAMELLGTT